MQKSAAFELKVPRIRQGDLGEKFPSLLIKEQSLKRLTSECTCPSGPITILANGQVGIINTSLSMPKYSGSFET